MLTRTLLILIALALALGFCPQDTHAQADCLARIVWAPVGDGLPVKAQPSYWGPDAQPYITYQVGDIVPVMSALSNTANGELWFGVPSGYIQAYSGWSTNVTEAQIITECTLPHTDARYVAIPAIGLHEQITTAPIVEREHRIGNGVMWLDGTAWIDADWARIVLAGHTPGIFTHVINLRAGDVVIVWDSVRVEIYVITDQVTVDPSDNSYLMPTDRETLALLTCAGDLRTVVQAEKVN